MEVSEVTSALYQGNPGGSSQEHSAVPAQYTNRAALLLSDKVVRGGADEGYAVYDPAIDRGVSIELITSAKRDQPVYKYIKNGLLMRRLIRKGVSVYESHEKVLHAKAYIFDDRLMTVGSLNNDRWSWRISN